MAYVRSALDHLSYQHAQDIAQLITNGPRISDEITDRTKVPRSSSSSLEKQHQLSREGQENENWSVAVEARNLPNDLLQASPGSTSGRRIPSTPVAVERIKRITGADSPLFSPASSHALSSRSLLEVLGNFKEVAADGIRCRDIKLEDGLHKSVTWEEAAQRGNTPPGSTPPSSDKVKFLKKLTTSSSSVRKSHSGNSIGARPSKYEHQSPSTGEASGESTSTPTLCFEVHDDFREENDQVFVQGMERSADDHGSLERDSEPIPEPLGGARSILMRFSIRHPASYPRLVWEASGVVVLFYDIIMIPMQAFKIPASLFLTLMSWLILWYWTLDIPAAFLVGYYTDEGAVVFDLHKIARRYMHSWFGIDLLIVGIDWISILVALVTGGGFIVDGGGGDGGSTGNLSIVRVGKVLRVLRLMRLVRVMKLSSSNFVLAVQDRFDSERLYVIANLVKNVLVILCINHFTACIWYWVGSYPIEGYGCWVDHYGVDEKSWTFAYLTSLHWSLAQFANGEVLIEPQNVPERIVSIVVLVISIIIFSSFIAIVGSTVSQLINHAATLRRDSFVLRLFMRQHGVTFDLKMRVNRYVGVINMRNTDRVDHKDVKLFDSLSRPLQQELLTELYEKILTIHPFLCILSQRSQTIMRSLCCEAVRQVLLCRDDILFSTGQVGREMFLIAKGKLRYNHRREVLVGEWFGEAVLWAHQWVTCGRMEAVTECELVALGAEKFREVTTIHHSAHLRLPREYAAAFVETLNQTLKGQMKHYHLDDCHSDLVQAEAVREVLTKWTIPKSVQGKGTYIGSMSDLAVFGVRPSVQSQEQLTNVAPN